AHGWQKPPHAPSADAAAILEDGWAREAWHGQQARLPCPNPAFPPLAHLFLSHSSADDGFVRELRQALADLGQEVWIDSRQLKGGDPLWSEIQAAIEKAAGLAVLVSPKAFESDWVARELKHALKLQAERGRQAFPVILLALNGTKPASLAGYFDEEPASIAVSSAPGGATAALHDILVALGLRLPSDQPPVLQPRPEPVEELVLELSNLRFHEEGGVRRAAGTAQLIYQPATVGQREVKSGKWRLVAPLGPIEAEDLSWYLERWAVWPNPVVAERANAPDTS
ncbi:MAG: toll/interleukin-1 receptor domain-containing protein, partial [Cyanobium sp.]